MQQDAIAGALLGGAVGDALGLPYEGLSRRRGVRLLGQPDRHRFLFGRGMVSDDTEHTCLVGLALCAHPTDPNAFVRSLGWGLRWWLLGLPAGVGWATLRAAVKLWVGIPPAKSGVFSAGNGPAMRSALLGAAIDDLGTLKRFVRASTRLTHTDPRAWVGACAVALAAWCAKRHTPEKFPEMVKFIDGADETFRALIDRIEASVAAGESTEAFALGLGCLSGVTGYVTVPVALHAWRRHPENYRAAVTAVIRCGGDADTTAAIVGGIVGSGVGRSGLPREWLDGVGEWPRSVEWMEALAAAVERAVSQGVPTAPPRTVPLVGYARNAVFLGAMVAHVIRRMLPPY